MDNKFVYIIICYDHWYDPTIKVCNSLIELLATLLDYSCTDIEDILGMEDPIHYLLYDSIMERENTEFFEKWINVDDIDIIYDVEEVIQQLKEHLERSYEEIYIPPCL